MWTRSGSGDPGSSACTCGEPLDGGPLEDLDLVALAQLHDGLFPARLRALVVAAPLGLGLHLDDVHALDLDVEELLDGLADLGLVRLRVDAERILVVLDQAVALLGDHWGDEDLARVEAHDASSCTRSSAASVASTEFAQTSAPTSSSDGSRTRTRSRLRKDFATADSSGCAMTTSGSSLLHVPRSVAAARVDGSEKADASTTPSDELPAWWLSAPRSADLRAFRLTFSA